MRPNVTRPSEARFEDMIKRHMASPGHVPAPEPRADFIMSGIRAAGAATPLARRKILTEMADVMNCKAEDLDFLFAEFAMPVGSAANYEVMVPDFQRELLTAAE